MPGVEEKHLSKHAGLLLEQCYCAYAGLSDKHLVDALAENVSLASLASKLTSSGGGGPVGEALRELRSALQSHRRIIAVDITASAPPPSTRTLVRYDSEAAEEGQSRAQADKERQEAWGKAQALRRKFATVSMCAAGSALTATRLDQIYEKCVTVSGFKGQSKERHRAFVFSADLLTENAREPWKHLSEPAELPQLTPMIDFMLSKKKPFDILLFCDGRSRKMRRVIEDRLEASGRQHVGETWVVYGGHDSCSGRGVPWSANNREVIFVVFPVNRASFPVKEREHFNACGEESTHFGTYTGVTPLSIRRMAKVRPEDKQAILASSSEQASPPERLIDNLNGACPIFWQERKPVPFWRQLLNDLDVRAVCDMTPGSGVLAQACLLEGWPYLGIAPTAAHCSYMQNRIDRDAIGIISTAASAMYDEDLAALIKEHFQDLVDEFNAADNEEEDEDDEDEKVEDEEDV